MSIAKLLSTILGVVALAAAPLAMAAEAPLKLAAHPGSSVLSAGVRQKIPIKISLTGVRAERAGARAPVNVAIVLDRSGSMSGDKLEHAKEAAIEAVRLLSANDIVSVVTYDDAVEVLVPATKASDTERIVAQIRKITLGGSTALFSGVSKGAAELQKFRSRDRVNRVLLLSDGHANVGPSSPSELGRLGVSLRKDSISVSTMGLGLGFNEDLMTQLAMKSDGNHAFIENPTQLASIFQREFGDILSVVAQNIRITIDCPAGVRPLRVLGRESDINGQQVTLSLNQLYADQEKYIVLEAEIDPLEDGASLTLASIKVRHGGGDAALALSSDVAVRFSSSSDAVAGGVNREAMEAFYTQLAFAASDEVIALRDAGRTDDARKLLLSNSTLLEENAKKLQSKTLERQAESLAVQGETIVKGDWNKARKSMRADQFKAQNQQSF